MTSLYVWNCCARLRRIRAVRRSTAPRGAIRRRTARSVNAPLVNENESSAAGICSSARQFLICSTFVLVFSLKYAIVVAYSVIVYCYSCLYRIRSKKSDSSFALSVSYRYETKHYKIYQRKARAGVKFTIENGPPFDNLMDVSRIHNVVRRHRFHIN